MQLRVAAGYGEMLLGFWVEASVGLRRCGLMRTQACKGSCTGKPYLDPKEPTFLGLLVMISFNVSLKR